MWINTGDVIQMQCHLKVSFFGDCWIITDRGCSYSKLYCYYNHWTLSNSFSQLTTMANNFQFSRTSYFPYQCSTRSDFMTGNIHFPPFSNFPLNIMFSISQVKRSTLTVTKEEKSHQKIPPHDGIPMTTTTTPRRTLSIMNIEQGRPVKRPIHLDNRSNTAHRTDQSSSL